MQKTGQVLPKTKDVGRHTIGNSRRILFKVGTSVVTQPDGTFALGRLGNFVEEVADLVKTGRECIIVSSGAVGQGNQILRRNQLLVLPLQNHIRNYEQNLQQQKVHSRAAAAAGQSGMMSIYQNLFHQKGVSCSQVLLTDDDFRSEERKKNLSDTINILVGCGTVPIINENDVVSLRKSQQLEGDMGTFLDNDGLSALIAALTASDLMILLTDVEGIYNMHPENDEARIIHTYREDLQISVGEKSARGRGGMQSKIDAAKSAIKDGVPSVVIASGFIQNNISRLFNGENVGTLFTARMNDPVEDLDSAEILASKANQGGDLLRSLTCEDRNRILTTIANNLMLKKDSILAANLEDLRLALRLALTTPHIDRLKLTEDKLVSLSEGIKQIANAPDPIGKIISVTEISDGLVLTKETTPLGVLLAIFESHPDDLPQLAALAIKSGNALLVKGGKEIQNTNDTLHKILCDSVEEATSQLPLKVPRSVIGLVKSREDISTLLALEKDIAMIIPRGSTKLIRDIQKRSKIPVLGHSEGVCHIYVHSDANIDKAIRIIVDAKLDSPSALNSVETVLINQELLEDDRGARIMKGILKKEIVIHGCRRAVTYAKLHDLYLNPLKTTYHHEYNDRQLTVAIVNDLSSAIEHINNHGSGHTESIVTESIDSANLFMDGCESACVFHNASTRFADGYRFGVGAEVGTSTSRIHARGPVGVEGLLTAKWKLRSSNPEGDIVGAHTNGEKSYTHKRLSKL